MACTFFLIKNFNILRKKVGMPSTPQSICSVIGWKVISKDWNRYLFYEPEAKCSVFGYQM